MDSPYIIKKGNDHQTIRYLKKSLRFENWFRNNRNIEIQFYNMNNIHGKNRWLEPWIISYWYDVDIV